MFSPALGVTGLDLRLAQDADEPSLRALPFSSGMPGKHRQRLDRQARGEASYLLAGDARMIIGHLLLKWDCPEDSLVRALVRTCAEIEDFVVDPALTGRGIGSAMLEFAAGLCRDRGETRLGLAVGLENPYAREFYERRGFVPVPASAHRVTWLAPTPSGQEIEEAEECIYLEQELS
jgi:GNAT superfamily N-acetyltransferase